MPEKLRPENPSKQLQIPPENPAASNTRNGRKIPARNYRYGRKIPASKNGYGRKILLPVSKETSGKSHNICHRSFWLRMQWRSGRFCMLYYSCIRPTVHQVVFTDVQITIRQRVAVLSVLGYWSELCSYGLHKTATASDWLLIKWHYLGKKGLPEVQVQNYSDYISYRRDFSIYRKEDVLFQLKIRVASEKFKSQPWHLLRPRSVNFRQHFQNLCHKTVPEDVVRFLMHYWLFIYCEKGKAIYFIRKTKHYVHGLEWRFYCSRAGIFKESWGLGTEEE